MNFLGLQTEVLEACNWCEEELKASLDEFRSVLESINLSKHTSDNIFIHIENKLKDSLGKTKALILIRILNFHKEEIIELITLPEN